MLLPARWLCQAIFVVISGRARPHAEIMRLVCPRPATAVQPSLDSVEPCPRDRVDSCLDSPLLHTRRRRTPPSSSGGGVNCPRPAVPRAPLLAATRRACLYFPASQLTPALERKQAGCRTIFISHNASSVCAALRPPPTPFSVPFSHRLPPSVSAAQSPRCCPYSQVARVYTNNIAAVPVAATRSTGSCRTCTVPYLHRAVPVEVADGGPQNNVLSAVSRARDLNLHARGGGGGSRRTTVPVNTPVARCAV